MDFPLESAWQGTISNGFSFLEVSNGSFNTLFSSSDSTILKGEGLAFTGEKVFVLRRVYLQGQGINDLSCPMEFSSELEWNVVQSIFVCK